MGGYDCTQDFLDDLAGLADLPTEKRGEWFDVVRSRWIDGVFFNGRQDMMCTVALQRSANNEEAFDETQLEYEVSVLLGTSWNRTQGLTMDAQSAIRLGHHLIAAGTTGMRDLAKHAWFAAGHTTPEAVTR